MPLVALDLDGTLLDQDAAAHAWATEFVTEWALPADEVERIAVALTARRPKGEVFAELARDWSVPLTSDQVWDAYRARMPELVRCTAEDLDALSALRTAGWTVGIVTNGMVDNQEGKIRRTGLAERVDGWVISAEVGSRKPDPAIFEALAAKVGCPLDGWMVGDSFELDIRGGAAAGLRTAWITDSLEPQHRGKSSITAPSVADAARQILSARCL